MFTVSRLLVLTLVISVAACGGGGGGGGGGGNGNNNNNGGGSNDTTPNAFSFTDQTDVNLLTNISSNAIMVSGIDAATSISIVGGEYQINGGSFTSAAGSVTNGQQIVVRQTSSDQFSTTTNSTITVGGVSDTFSVTTLSEDLDPDGFSFTDQTDVTLNTVITANAVTIGGINSAAPISITGGEYSIDGGAFTNVSGTVNNNQQVVVRQTSSTEFTTTTNATLSVGSGADIFSVTTIAEDLDPDAFTFIDQSNVSLNMQVVSNTVTITGINNAIPISIVGGEYSVDGNPYTSVDGVVQDSQSITIRQTSSAQFSTTTISTLSIGVVSEDFIVTTRAPDTIPDNFTFNDLIDVCTNSVFYSNNILVTGIDVDVPISINGGEYSVNGGSYTNLSGMVGASDNVSVRQISAATTSTTTDTTLTIGGLSDIFSTTTFSTPDVDPPIIDIHFPPLLSTTDDTSILVRGSGSDSCEITSVSINGINAISNDGFNTWEASVPLASGQNDLVVAATDIKLNTDMAADQASIKSSISIEKLGGLVYDSINSRVLVLDLGNRRLVAINEISGEATILSSDAVGTGVNFIDPRKIVYDSVSDTVYILDILTGIIGIDLATGNRTEISGPSIGTGSAFSFPVDIDKLPGSNELIVLDGGASSLISVSVSSGNRSPIAISAPNTLSDARHIALDEINNLVYFATQVFIYSVDLSSGITNQISSNSKGNGPFPNLYNELTLDPNTGNILALDGGGGNDKILEIDPVTGDRTVYAENDDGNGFYFNQPRAITVDETSSRVFLADWEPGAVLVIDQSTMARTRLSAGLDIGVGQAYGWVTDMVVDSDNNRILLTDSGVGGGALGSQLDAITAVDLSNGNRTNISNYSIGSGINLQAPSALDLNTDGDNIFVADSHIYSEPSAIRMVDPILGNRTVLVEDLTGHLIFDDVNSRIILQSGGNTLAVDPVTAATTELSGSTVGSGITMSSIGDADLSSTAEFLFLLHVYSGHSVVSKVNLITGERTLFSTDTLGQGPNFSSADGLALDEKNNRIVVIEGGSIIPEESRMLVVDLDTADRTVLYDRNTGSGPMPYFPKDVVVSEDAHVYYISDAYRDAIFAVDPISGNRVIVSK